MRGVQSGAREVEVCEVMNVTDDDGDGESVFIICQGLRYVFEYDTSAAGENFDV